MKKLLLLLVLAASAMPALACFRCGWGYAYAPAYYTTCSYC